MSKLIIPVAALIVLTLVIIVMVSGGASSISGDMIVNLIYFTIIGGLMASWLLAEKRGTLGENLKQLLIWGVIITVIALAYHHKSRFGF